MKDKPSPRGFSVSETIAILFIALKLDGVIDWPWLLVLSPIWLVVAAIILISLATWAADNNHA